MTTPNLKEFISEIKTRNIAKQNLFYVQITPPTTMLLTDVVDSSTTKLTSMWCHGAQTPHTFLMTNDNFIENGVRRKFPYDIDHQNLVLSFYVDQDFNVKRFFDEWKQSIIPNNRNFKFYDDYIAKSLTLSLLNQEDDITYQYEYTNVYPKTINSMEVSYMGSTVLSLNIEFVFEDVFYTSLLKSQITSTSKYVKPITITPPPVNRETSQEYSLYNGPITDELGNVVRGNYE